jgi:hypothetical protein
VSGLAQAGFNWSAPLVHSQVKPRPCPDCGVTITSPGRQRCVACSAARRAKSERQRMTSACAQCGQYRRANTPSGLCKACSFARNRKLIPCPRCGTQFWPWEGRPDHARKYCGSACWKPKAPPKTPKPIFYATCLLCSVTFRKRGERNTCCSKRCRANYQARLRKLKLKGLAPVVITAQHVYQRDGGACALCGEPVDMAIPYPHPLAPTVDHIIPVTRAGEHSMKNVQLAHARCNLSKGNRMHEARGGAGAGPVGRSAIAGKTGAEINSSQDLLPVRGAGA